ncbi:hypothetical protein B0T16DRAFT_186313 [Cercophora newfieldiana]|uniref:Uncharacterized protein n=1 Tax=Cercophora newfieldiana TaxID=92897 RepID=A0AA40CM58_9PEZI|nr:hypothetical protein B0T16DRAFT_186313 [Cercophora newfieldiana]
MFWSSAPTSPRHFVNNPQPVTEMDGIHHHHPHESVAASAAASWPRRSANNLVSKHEENMHIEKQETRLAMLYILPPSLRDRIPSRSSIMSMSFPSRVSSPMSEAETEVVDIEGPDDAPLPEPVAYPAPRKFSSTISIRSSSTLSSRSASPKIHPSGVSWRHARQGIELITSSIEESKHCADPDYYNSAFERSSYVTGVRYLLDGLPEDLDESEVMFLHSSMPPPLVEGMDYPATRNSRVRRREQLEPQAPPNLVHKIMILVLTYLELGWNWAWPRALYLTGEIIRVERERQVLRVLLEIATVVFMWVCSMWDSFAGQTASRALRYGTEGVEGAFKEFANRRGPRQRTR